MATGASTADLAVLLVDASQGLSRQTRRHSLILSMLGIRQVILAINKMDLVGWSEERYAAIMEQYALFARELGFDSVVGVPLSALNGDNVVQRGVAAPWYDGFTLLQQLEAARPRASASEAPFPLSGAVGEPAERVVPRLCRPRQRRNRVDRRPGARRALGRRGQRRPHRHV